MARYQPETQLIFRAPPDLAEELHALLERGEGEEFFELTPMCVTNRQGEQVTQFKFRLGDVERKASIVDLPCVLESHKTLDGSALFKSGNLSQMVYVHPGAEQFLEDVPDFAALAAKTVEVSEKGARTVRYLARDGLTPPTVDVRNRFFRRGFPVAPERVGQVEREMVAILKECREKKKAAEQPR